MNIQRAINAMHRAIEKFNLIDDGDKVAIGLSGGKDSLLLTACLGTYQKFSKRKFSLIALCVDSFKNIDTESLENFCKRYNIEFKLIPSDIGEVVFNVRKEKNPCSLCAKMRRGALCSTCKELGFNKLALAHNADDMIETFMLSLKHENRLNAMQPKSYMSNTNVTLIRPLIYLWESQILEYTKGFKILKNPCPIDRKTERENIKKIIVEINKIFPDFNKKLFEGIINYERYNLIKN